MDKNIYNHSSQENNSSENNLNSQQNYQADDNYEAFKSTFKQSFENEQPNSVLYPQNDADEEKFTVNPNYEDNYKEDFSKLNSNPLYQNTPQQTAPQNDNYSQVEWNSNGEMVSPPNNNQQNQHNPYAQYVPQNIPYYNQTSNDSSPKSRKAKKNNKDKKGSFIALAVCLCIIASTAFSFGGTYLANYLNKANNSTTGVTDSRIIYQSVVNKDQNGNDITTPLTTEQVVEATANSVVEITTESMSTGSFFQQAVQKGAGSGVIITSDGYIMTNNHVISGANKVTVRTKDGNEYNATLVGTDETTDIAIIKIDASNLKAAVLGSSSNASVGQTAIAIGNPLGKLGGTVTQGIISALDRTIVVENKTMTLLQIDAAINPGNSGGGLFNNYGELIGIVNAGYSGTDVDGLGFAVPIDIAKPVMESLMEHGYVVGRPYMGVSLIEINDTQTAYVYKVNELGLYVAKVSSDSPAAQAGIQSGDRIVSINDVEISTTSEFSAQLDKYKAGDSVKLTIKSGLTEKSITVTLAEKNNTSTTSN